MTIIMEYSISSMLRLLLFLQLWIVQSHAFAWMSPPSMCNSTHTPAPRTDDRPIPSLPELPKQYSMKVEANILQKSWTTEVEEHYDGVNDRASLSVTRNGSSIVTIFNLKDGERYDIYPNGTCQTRTASIDYMGFVSMGKLDKPVLATVNEIFRFGASFDYTYVGKEIVRGISVNHWTSCQHWEDIGAKFQLDYYFSDPDFTTAAGKEQIPVRAVLNGSANNVGMVSQHLAGTHTFQHVYDFTSFRVGPIYNEEVFQIPPGIVCKGRRNNKPMPQLPDRFEMFTEVIVLDKQGHPRQERIRYDYTHKLVETWNTLVVPEGLDVRNSRTAQGQPDNDKLSIISGNIVEDFHYGLIYVMEKLNMTCMVQRMPPSRVALGMAHGRNLLTIAAVRENGPHNFLYQGQSTVRQMKVDVWAMESQGLTLEVYFLPDPGTNPFPTLVGMFMRNRTATGYKDLPTLFQEMFTPESTPWGGSSSQSGLPDTPPPTGNNLPPISGDQLAWGLELERLIEQGISQKLVNIFHYTPLHTDSTNFQVSLCYHDDQISQVMLVIMTKYDQDVLHNFVAFSNSLREALAEKTGVSVLQISNLVPLPLVYKALKIDATKVTFTLLGAAPVEGSQQKPITQAKQDLVRAIQNGITFRVQYPTYSKEFVVDKISYALDYDKFTLSTAQNPSPSPGSPSPTPQTPDSGKKGTDSQNSAVNDKQIQTNDNSGSSGYSSGAVAGIAFATLILGGVMTLGVVFLLYKRKHPEASIPYQMTS